jgi:hypothetical protein
VIGAFFRSITDSVSVIDAMDTIGTFIVSLQDSVNITDALASLKRIFVSLADTVNITDILALAVTQIIFLIKEIERTVKYTPVLRNTIKFTSRIVETLRSNLRSED